MDRNKIATNLVKTAKLLTSRVDYRSSIRKQISTLKKIESQLDQGGFNKYALELIESVEKELGRMKELVKSKDK